jgi:hypothetical protein
MKAAFLALSTLVSTLGLHAQSLAPSPYVETTTLTFFWGFTSSYISNIFSGVPNLPGTGTFDPGTLPSGFESWTDTLRPLAYTGPALAPFPAAGANQQIIQLLLQRMVRSNQIGKTALAYRWQIIAVREAPANVRELATNPYRIFLAAQPITSPSPFSPLEAVPYGSEAVVDDPLPEVLSFLDTTPDDLTPGTPVVTLDTGMTLTLGGFSGSYTETNWGAANNKVRSASGSVATAFTINFGAVSYEDPKHNVDAPDTDPYNYHLKRNYWEASASGLINYGIRSTPIPFPTFVASNTGATGTGWFYHQRDEVEYKDDVPKLADDPANTKVYRFSGIAPLRVTMSTIQYQKRDRFFALRIPSTPRDLAISYEPNSGALPFVRLRWSHYITYEGDTRRYNDFTETHFLLEREVDESGIWEEIPRLEANTLSYVDTSIKTDKTYTYTYRIRAANGGGASDYVTSDPVSVPKP